MLTVNSALNKATILELYIYFPTFYCQYFIFLGHQYKRSSKFDFLNVRFPLCFNDARTVTMKLNPLNRMILITATLKQ